MLYYYTTAYSVRYSIQFDTLGTERNGFHFADIFKNISLEETLGIFIQIWSLKFVYYGAIDDMAALF